MAPRKKKSETESSDEPTNNLVNITAEEMTLGALLLSPHSYWDVSDILKADHFSAPLHQQIFNVMSDLIQAGKQVSMPVLLSRLPEQTEDGKEMEALLHLFAAKADGQSAADFAAQVAELASRRQLIKIAETIVKEAKNGTKTAIESAGNAEQAILEVMRVSSPARPKLISESIERVMSTARATSESGVLPGYTTGLNSLDEILGLILGGDAGAILASQGEGKSTLAAQIAMHIAKDRPVLFVQLEMSDEQMAARELAAGSGISVGAIQEGCFNRFDLDLLLDAKSRLVRHQLYILDEAELTVRQIGHHAMAMQRTIGLGAIVIDQLDKVKPSSGKPKDKFERLADVTRDSKVLAKRLRVPVIMLAQRTRGAQRRDDPTPDILDADAPSLERDCDWVIAAWRDEGWLRRNKPSHDAGPEKMDKWEADMRRARETAKIITLKHRRRQAFEQRSFKWIGHLPRFEELAG